MSKSSSDFCIWHRAKRYHILVTICFAVLAVDQASKIWIHHFSSIPLGYYPPFAGYEIVPGFFNIVFNTNTGAAWGMFSGYSTILLLLAIGALVAIYWFRDALFLRSPVMQIAFGLLCGGIMGNLIDRLMYGYVIDFLDFTILGYRWPTFNVADSAITIGVGIYIIFTLRHPTPTATGSDAARRRINLANTSDK